MWRHGTHQGSNTWLAALEIGMSWRGVNDSARRLGYAADRVLFYGTGGAAYGNVQANVNGVTSSSTKAGWTAGAGVEAAFADNWTARLEYLYVDLSKASCGTACGGAPINVTFTQNLVRAGIDYKFR